MKMRVIDRYDPFKGEMLQVLDPSGEVREELEPEFGEEELLSLYRYMVLTRMADEKAVKLQRTGRLGTYAPSRGHEAAQVGSAYALKKEDWMFPYFRDLGAHLVRGYPLRSFYLYWMGSEEGMRIPEGVNNFTIAIPVGSQVPHAVGASWAAKILGHRIAVMVFFGDGATSEGDFHEGMNFSGVFRTPTVFVCLNNQYAISVPRSRQTASETLAQKANAYGFQGVLVDGNDVLAVYVAAREALEKAREGGGPTFIEAYTYRLGDHTTSDDARRYRSEEEVRAWEKREPLIRFRAYLERKGIWSQDYEEELRAEISDEISRAVEEAEAVPPPAVEDLFRYNYAEMPWNLREQMEELREFLSHGGRSEDGGR
jgi:pyruvate dehydrogenase E1 component alpha subunit